MWDLVPGPGIEPRLPALAGRFFTISTTWEAQTSLYVALYILFGEGNGTPLQYSCLENPMDGGAWWAAVHGVAKGQT